MSLRGLVPPDRRVNLLVGGRAADQGALFVGSLFVARAIGPAAFAPVAALLVFNSLSVQLSDLGLGFAVHSLPTSDGMPGASLRRVRWTSLIVFAGAVILGALLQSPLVVAAGCVWGASAEAYLRKAATLRGGHPARIARSEIAGAAAFLACAAVAGDQRSTALVAVGLVAKHVIEVALLPRPSVDDPAGRLSSHQEWVGQIATFAASNVDYLVVGLLLPATALSVYVMAFRMMGALPALVGHALTQTTFVDLEGAVDAERTQALHRAIPTRIAPIAVVALAVGIVAAALGQQVLGEGWSALLMVAAVLGAALPFRLALGPSVAVAIAAGRAREVIRAELVRLVLVAGLVAVGCSLGVVGAAAGSAMGAAAGIALLHRRALPVTVAQPVRS